MRRSKQLHIATKSKEYKDPLALPHFIVRLLPMVSEGAHCQAAHRCQSFRVQGRPGAQAACAAAALALLYLAAWFYSRHLPERWRPGAYDLFGNSHQARILAFETLLGPSTLSGGTARLACAAPLLRSAAMFRMGERSGARCWILTMVMFPPCSASQIMHAMVVLEYGLEWVFLLLRASALWEA